MMRMVGRSMCSLILAALIACVCLTQVEPALAEDQPGEITLEWGRLFVKIKNGPAFSIMVDPNGTVGGLFLDISELEGVPFHRINQAGNFVSVHEKLYDYVRTGTQLTLAIPEDRYAKPVKLIVKTHEGREMPVDTLMNNTVASLKDSIREWTDIQQASQRLLLRGKELKDDRRFIDYNIMNGAELTLGRPLEESSRVVSIFVKTLSGVTIEVEVNRAATVDGLKERIRERASVPAGVQRLAANGRMIFGEDHLCDLGLEAGSTVYMFLFSPRITSLDQVARLSEPLHARPLDNSRAPIFREAEGVAGRPVESGRRGLASLYKDAYNWIAADGGRPGWNWRLFNSVALLDPNPDSEEELQRRIREVASYARDGIPEPEGAKVLRAQIKLGLAVRPYRATANLSSGDQPGHRPGISLAGGFVDTELVSLGADLNNWAPDSFRDSDVMSLFEVSARARQMLAEGAQTGEAILSLANQRRINSEILDAYVGAHPEYPPFVEYDQPRDGEECAICRDPLTAEPAIMLPCKHTFHADCVLSWATDFYKGKRIPRCPLCRQRFSLPPKVAHYDQLKTPEFRAGHVEES